MIVVVSVVLLLETLLSPLIPLLSLRTIIIMIVALLLHFFLSTSLLAHYKRQEENLKNLVEETLHELNTPIATIEANLKMLQKSHTDEKTLKRLSRISLASKNLSALYEGIEHSIKSEIEHTQKEPFNLYDTIEKSIQKMRDIQGDIQIENHLPSLWIEAEKRGFERVIDNLLSNAIKYNKKEGFVKFFLRHHQLCIQDSGYGIDTKNLFIIFEKAYQENPTTKGYGIGLSIVKSYCDKEKITIKIETKKEEGTTILLDINHLLTNN
jgi:signal transduction histidine kinase